MESIFGNCYVISQCMNYKVLTSEILFWLNWYATFNAEWTIQIVLIFVYSSCRILHDRNLNSRLVNQVVFILYDAVHCFCLTRCILALSYLRNPLFLLKLKIKKGGWGDVALTVFWIKLLKRSMYINMYFIYSRTSNI